MTLRILGVGLALVLASRSVEAQPEVAAESVAAAAARDDRELPAANDGIEDARTLRPGEGARLVLQERRLEWAPWLGTFALLGSALALEIAIEPTYARARFSGPIDDGFGGWVLHRHRARERAAKVSDALVLGLLLAPLGEVIGSHLETRRDRGRRTRGREAYRLLTAASLSFATQALLVTATKNLVRRARPYDARCDADPASHPSCNSSRRYRSFVSGHASAAFTSASLLCAFQRLRGRRGAAQRVGCLVGLATASVVAGLRMASERHYFSDVLGGAVVGFLSGWVLPLFVYPRDLQGTEGSGDEGEDEGNAGAM